jgi:hypothetical protein
MSSEERKRPSRKRPPAGWAGIYAFPTFLYKAINETFIRKISPALPLPKGGITLFGKEGRGEIFPCLYQFNFETLDMIEN